MKARPDEADGLVGPTSSPNAETRTDGDYRIALLTPYDGGNLGDGAIQDAMIENIRRSLPGVRLAGICLSCEEFLERHGVEGFPLCETDRPFYRMVRQQSPAPATKAKSFLGSLNQRVRRNRFFRKVSKKLPTIGFALRSIRNSKKEVRHWIESYRFLRDQDLLIVSGGGQLDEEWGGPWGHPFALFKWTLLARIAGLPCAFASVGASRVKSATSRFLVSTALRLARYRSYRDKNSRDIATDLFRGAAHDPIIPDLAFGLSVPELPAPVRIRSVAGGRKLIAISPIAFAKPYNWPKSDINLYRRYLKELTQVVAVLLRRGYFLVLLTSSRGDDESVIPDILEGLDEGAKTRAAQQVHVPRFTTWKGFANAVRDADLLIASRLHSTILGFVVHCPTIAVSFDPKVDWVMNDLGQPEFLLQIREFVAEDVLKNVERIEQHRAEIIQGLSGYQNRVTTELVGQYEALAKLARDSHRVRFQMQN
jgi:polysaccharide pyruvyl transferase WcaK-like protein